MAYAHLKSARLILIGSICLAAFILVLSLDPIAQDQQYHRFADTDQFVGIANFANVISNLFFLLVGSCGAYLLVCGRMSIPQKSIKHMYLVFFVSIALVSFGSAYYHLRPDNQTLVWDRLPMAVAFMALFSIIVAEFASVRASRIVFLPLISAGLASVFYWYFGEVQGQGDLRFYLLVQFLPIALIPLFLILFKTKFDKSSAYWWLLLAYIIAKLCEIYDAEIFSALSLISGHTLKHIVAAIGLWVLMKAYSTRRMIE